MSKYFRETQDQKINLFEYYNKVEKEYNDIEEELKKHSTGGYVPQDIYNLIENLKYTKRRLSLKYARIKHIYKSLGEVLISEGMIETICQTFDETKCRYGTVCFKEDSVRTLYKISELLPELSAEALIAISRVYIKDLFDKYSLIDTLCTMIKSEGPLDSTFEKFMETLLELADKEDGRYKTEAYNIQLYYGYYSFNFISHFQKFIKQHHITFEKFSGSIPELEMILKDESQLRDIQMRSRECWSWCNPISYQMFEAYLDGDTELSKFDEQPAYYISTVDKRIPITFTKA